MKPVMIGMRASLSEMKNMNRKPPTMIRAARPYVNTTLIVSMPIVHPVRVHVRIAKLVGVQLVVGEDDVVGRLVIGHWSAHLLEIQKPL